MYCHLGKTQYQNYNKIASVIHQNYPWLKYIVQFGFINEIYTDGLINGHKLIKEAEHEYNEALDKKNLLKEFENECEKVGEKDPILLIFTMGTTAFPKPTMLTNLSITCQNMCLAKAFNITGDDRMLVNMPFAFIGGSTEQLMTVLYVGGTAIILHRFEAEKSLLAIQDYKITCLGQIPASYSMEWNLHNYSDFDLSSLKHAIYSGQSVDVEFLEKLSKMAPRIGTGLGLTETSGLCTYTPEEATFEEILNGLGHSFTIYPTTIRAKMNDSGFAGDVLPDGEIGEICFEGPQTFFGYLNYEVATRAVLSYDAILYTGDMGYKDEKGIHLAGRKKYMINPKGYRVFKPEIEEFISEIPEVENVGVLGAKHFIYTEGIVAYIKVKDNANLTLSQINMHCKGMASYKRPSLIVFLDEFPLTKNDRPDYIALLRRLDNDIKYARANGHWD